MITIRVQNIWLTCSTPAADAKSEKYMIFDGFDELAANEEDAIQAEG